LNLYHNGLKRGLLPVVSFLEQAIKSPASIVSRTDRVADGLGCFPGSEKVAEIRFFSILNPFGVRLPATIAKRRLIVRAVHAGVEIGTALTAFIGSADESLDFDLRPTVVAIHGDATP